MSAIPDRIIVYACDKCGRKDWTQLGLRPGHFWRGDRCGGTVVRCSYIYEPETTAPENLRKPEGC